METVKRVGTFCAVIQKNLVVAVCPLPAGVCTWKHRHTGVCQYDPTATDLKAGDLATRVGLPQPSEAQISQLKTDLHDAIKDALR